MKRLYEKIDKSIIPEMPKLVFPGRIFVITTERDAEEAVNYLLTFPLVGIDTETKPSFHRNVTNKVALLQVSTDDTCFLFRLNRLKVSPAVMRFLESDVVKVGASLNDDIRMMSRRAKFTPGHFIDVQDMIGQLGIQDRALRKMYANLFGMNISKHQQLSNWEADILTDAQMQYAATDAWACIHIYNEINRLLETHDYELIPVPIDNEENISQER